MESNNLYIIDASGEKMAIDLDALRENATNAERQRILKLIEEMRKEVDNQYDEEEKALAKELKDAGFPGSDKWDLETGMYFTPTLSTLIEECFNLVDQRKALYFQLDFHFRDISLGDKFWMACVGQEIVAKGRTPEEAVAALWLKLKEIDETL